jgi:FtsH-binding integral membrane protein
VKYSKAIVAVVGAALTAALGTVPPDTQVFQILTVVAAVLTALGVYGVENKDEPKGEAGVVDVVLLFVVATFVLAVLIFCGVHLHTH